MQRVLTIQIAYDSDETLNEERDAAREFDTATLSEFLRENASARVLNTNVE